MSDAGRARHFHDKAQRFGDDNDQVRDILARIVGAFTSGVYCSNCGHSVDICDCIIGEAREVLAPSLRSGAMS